MTVDPDVAALLAEVAADAAEGDREFAELDVKAARRRRELAEADREDAWLHPRVVFGADGVADIDEGVKPA